MKKKMSSFEEFLARSTAPGPEQILPGTAVIVVDKDGIIYSHCSGSQSVDPGSPLANKPMSLDTTMWAASCTKLMTAVSVMQCVEKGLLDLDADVSSILHEFKNPDILTGFEEDTGKPILVKAKNTITLRMLLNHSSGLCLSMIDPRLIQWATWEGKLPPKTDESLHNTAFVPLLFEPGTGWSYSYGLEWAGQMVERVNGGQSLNDYMNEHIWEPLNMKSTSFRLSKRPDIASELADMSFRPPGMNSLVKSPTHIWSPTMPEDHGGAGVWTCAGDYVKLLSALLRDDGKILKPKSIDLLFATPSLSPESKLALEEVIYNNPRPVASLSEFSFLLAAGVPRGCDQDYALSGLVNGKDVKSENREGLRRKKGSVTWSGVPNLQWVIDRESGRATFYATQLLPPGDKLAVDAARRFEEAVNAGDVKLERGML